MSEYNQNLYHKWVPGLLIALLTVVMLVIILITNPIYSSNIVPMMSSTGIYSEYFVWANYSVMIGMVLTLPLFMRLKFRFRAKETLITALCVMALMPLVTASTYSGVVMVGACMIYGMAKVLAIIEVVMIFFGMICRDGNSDKFYSVLFPMAITTGPIGGLIASKVAFAINWQMMHYYTSAVCLLMALVAVIVCHNQRFGRKTPLYYIDWLGMLLYGITLSSLAYVYAFGRQQDWFVSGRITFAVVLCLASFFAFITRQLTVKRPYMILKVYKRTSVRMGVLLLACQGMFVATASLLTMYTSAILGYNWQINASLGLMMIPGLVVSGFVSFFWTKRKLPVKMLIFSGFGAYFLNVVMLYWMMVPGLNIEKFLLPQFLVGYGMGTLYINVWMYMLGKLPLKDKIGSISTAVILRSLVITGFFATLYGWLNYKFQWQSVGNLAVYFDAITMSHYPGTGSLHDVQLNAILAANKRLLGYIIIAGIGVLMFVFFHMFGREKNIFAKHRVKRSGQRPNEAVVAASAAFI